MPELAYVKIFLDWTEATRKLKDQEKGRLMDAIIAYAKGETEETVESRLTGNEAYVFPVFQLQIDRDRAAGISRSQINQANGSKGGAPVGNRNAAKQPKQPKTTETTENNQIPIEKEKEEENIEEDVDEENACAREEMPFGLTEEDIASSLERDQRIEDAALSVGLQITEAGMLIGRRLANQYGTDALIDAIGKSVDVPKWSYVEAILTGKGGRRNGNGYRGNNRGHESTRTEPSGKYAHLFDHAAI